MVMTGVMTVTLKTGGFEHITVEIFVSVLDRKTGQSSVTVEF